METYTPDLDPAVLGRLREYAALFAADFPQAKPARWAGVYLHGLLTDGDRKSVEPLSHRVTCPTSKEGRRCDEHDRTACWAGGSGTRATGLTEWAGGVPVFRGENAGHRDIVRDDGTEVLDEVVLVGSDGIRLGLYLEE